MYTDLEARADAEATLAAALTSLQPQIESVILIGALAVYRRLDPPGYPDGITHDVDIVIRPDSLSSEPHLQDLLGDGDFHLVEGRYGKWTRAHRGRVVELDVLVPRGVTVAHGTRQEHGAVLTPHQPTVARREVGVEPSLVDYSLVDVGGRAVYVAGLGALLVGKVFKVSSRFERGDWNLTEETQRKVAKSCYDIQLLLTQSSQSELSLAVRRLVASDASASSSVAHEGLRRLRAWLDDDTRWLDLAAEFSGDSSIDGMVVESAERLLSSVD